MEDKSVRRVEVSIGDVHGSQLVVGDHNTIQTPEGTEVTVLQVGERPVPRLRPLPVSRRPGAAAAILGRDDDLALVAAASADGPVQLYAGDGAGKTCLLKLAAREAPERAEGVVFEPVRRRSLDEIQAVLYRAFWECDIPFVPSPAQMADFLGEREALLILDDCGLDRDDVETLLDSLPRCAVVLASERRTLWSRGTARELGGLDPGAGADLLERELGRELAPPERASAEALAARLGGRPQSLVEAAALIEDGHGSLRELAEEPAGVERLLDPSLLSESQARILAALATLDGAALGVEQVASLAGVADAQGLLDELERRGWAKSASPRYRSLRLDPGRAPDLWPTLGETLLAQLGAWSAEAGPAALAAEAEAIGRALELGRKFQRWDGTLALARNAERGLAVAGAWTARSRVLRLGLQAADELGDRSARAHLLHQMGSQALCLGRREEAAALLGEALSLRVELGEREGAELTRHNLGQLGGGGNAPNGDGGGGGGPRPPRIALAIGCLAVAVGIVAALALGSGGGEEAGGTRSTRPPGSTTTTKPTTTTTTTTTRPPVDETPPVITIVSPSGSYEQGARVMAEYSCADTESEPTTCAGEVEDQAPVDTKTPGAHSFTITATDSAGNSGTREAKYTVEPPSPTRSHKPEGETEPEVEPEPETEPEPEPAVR